MAQKCPLCSSETKKYMIADSKIYLICLNCDLVFLAPQFHLSINEEKKRYDLHENDPDDENYKAFLSRLFKPIIKRIKPPTEGLDYGCGPGPALADMFEEKGYTMKTYDPIYQDDQEVLKREYDFITCSEVVEHFYNPRAEFRRLISLLKVGGILGIMTEIRVTPDKFETWYYRRDPTHVCFYSERTFEWLSDKFGLEREKISNRVNLFKKMGSND